MAISREPCWPTTAFDNEVVRQPANASMWHFWSIRIHADPYYWQLTLLSNSAAMHVRMGHGASKHLQTVSASIPGPAPPPAAGVIVTSISRCIPASIRDTVASASTTFISVSGT
ncbi:hypothetical protein CCMA1212_006709 [Trichoderma ghanense]|uniref:Uncharacterized protein n=1 Tax=Trichoderma ghanense TaxID=65468 RepID=A0ABY2GYU4_9HYPO